MNRIQAARDWINDRLGAEPVIHLAEKKEVPVHRHSVWYYFGGMTLFLFSVQVVTGILLLLYYRPSAENAFESVQFIVTEVEFGWLIRNVHSWSANLLILTLFIHMFSVYFLSAYRKPREMTWISGVFLFLISIFFGFSGYLLPWNELAFFATKVGTDIAGDIPIVGESVLRFLRGGDEVTGATLTRFYGFHVAILPATATVFLALHLWLVQYHGMSVPPGQQKKEGPKMKFFPNFVLRDLIGWLIAVALLAALSAFFPWELGVKADPFAPAPAGIKPEWYFLFMFQTLKYIPAKILIFEGEMIGVVGFSLAAIVWFVIPFFDRENSSPRLKMIFTAYGIFAVVFIAVMTVIGYLA